MTTAGVLRTLPRVLVVLLFTTGVIAAAVIGLVLANAPSVVPWRESLAVPGRSAPRPQRMPTPR